MNLPPDKVRLLRSYDNEKKWELICDQVGALQKVSKVCMFLATTRPTAAISKMFHKTENDYEDEADSVNLISAQKCTDFHQNHLFVLLGVTTVIRKTSSQTKKLDDSPLNLLTYLLLL